MEFKKVVQNLYRGSRMSADADYQLLSDNDIDIVLNLERGYFEFLHGEMNTEFEKCVRFNLYPLHIQLGDIAPPSLKELGAVVGLIQMTQNNGFRVFVHCLHGVDRTGMSIAAFRIKACGWSYEKAFEEMLSFGFHNFPYAYLGWTKRLKEFADLKRG